MKFRWSEWLIAAVLVLAFSAFAGTEVTEVTEVPQVAEQVPVETETR